MKNILFLIVFLLMFSVSPVHAAEFNLKEYNAYKQYEMQQTPELNQLSENVMADVNSSFAVIYNIGFQVFTVIFIAAIVALAGAITLKNGQWMKWSTNTMIFTLISILLIRLVPILFLTINVLGITLLLTYIIQLIMSTLFYVSFAMLLISLFLKMLYRMFEHPKYFKWSRSLLNGSVLVLILSIIMPSIIQNL